MLLLKKERCLQKHQQTVEGVGRLDAWVEFRNGSCCRDSSNEVPESAPVKVLMKRSHPAIVQSVLPAKCS